MPTRSSRRGHPTRCSRHSRVALPRRRDPRGRRAPDRVECAESGPRPTSVVSVVRGRRVRPAKLTCPRRSHVTKSIPSNDESFTPELHISGKTRAPRRPSTGPTGRKPRFRSAGLYEPRRAARRIHGLAFIRREVSPSGPAAPCSSPIGGSSAVAQRRGRLGAQCRRSARPLPRTSVA